MSRLVAESTKSHLKPQVNRSLKRLSQGSSLKSHELMHEPGLTEVGSRAFLSSLRASMSPQKVFDSAPGSCRVVSVIRKTAREEEEGDKLLRTPIWCFHSGVTMVHCL